MPRGDTSNQGANGGWNSMISRAPQRQMMTKAPMAMGRAPGLAGPGAGPTNNGMNQMAMQQRVAGGGRSPAPGPGVAPAMPGRPMPGAGGDPMQARSQMEAARAQKMKMAGIMPGGAGDPMAARKAAAMQRMGPNPGTMAQIKGAPAPAGGAPIGNMARLGGI